MKYSVLLLSEPRKQMARIPKQDRERLYEIIRGLADNPRPPGCLKLEASEGWRVRTGDYRVVYLINDDKKTVTLVRVRHRRDVYR